MTDIFRWKNCRADIASYRYGRMAHEFLNDVVEPSLETLNTKINELATSGEPAAPFICSDTKELLHATTMAFCLSIQSMWERQIRVYLRECARELNPQLADRAMHDTWFEIDTLFLELRGIRLSAFGEYEDLNSLQLLGNACRHGDGRSAKLLWERRPELWPEQRPSPPPFANEVQADGRVPSFATNAITLDHIQTFVEAIASFWSETEYIYLESIEAKDESVEVKLVQMREDRAKQGKKNLLHALSK